MNKTKKTGQGRFFCSINSDYLLRQKNGVNMISTVNSSSLPMSIKKADHHFPKSDNMSKLFTGLNPPNAGPMLPSEDAAPPMAV